MPLSRSSLSDAFRDSITTAILPASQPSAQSARKTPLNLSRTLSDAASHPNGSGVDTTSTAISVLKIVSEVSKAVGGVPYVESIASIVNSLVDIREEVEANKKQCQNLLDRVLTKIEGIFNHLGTLKSFLEDVLDTVTKLQNRPLYQRILDRGTDELDRLNQKMNDFDSNLLMSIVMKIMENLSNQAQKQQQNTSGGGEILRDSSISMHFPPGPIRIVEREDQHREIVSYLLSTPDARVALLGMGGIGKTTLACSIARDTQIVQAYPNRLFISFEGCSTADLAYTKIATTFKVPPGQRGSHNEILAHVQGYLSQKRTLFIIDNFETWWEVPDNRPGAEDFLGQLAPLQELALIVTLRGIQHPANNVIDWFEMRPLPTLTQDASMDLLSGLTKKKFTNSDLEYVRMLLNAVAGIPLAVTLISALLRDGSENPRSLWNQWDQEKTQAIGIAGEVDSDEHRLYKLDISLRLSIFGPRMSDNAKEFLAAISIIPTGLSMDDDELDKLQAPLAGKTRIRDCIRTLQNVALVTLDTSTSPNRLRMLPPVREFCLKNLPLDGEVARKLVDACNANLLKHRDMGSSEDYTWVTTELSNVTATINHAITLHYVADDFGWVIYLYSTWKHYLCMADTDIVERAITILSEHPEAQAKCLQSLGYILPEVGRAQEAIQPLEQALFIHTELGSKDEVVWDLYCLGDTHLWLGDYSKAEDCLNAAKDLVIEIGDKWKQGAVLHKLANAYLFQDKLPQAECAAEEALELERVSGSRKGGVNALSVLGRVYRAQGQYDLAIEKLKASRDASQVIHNTRGEAFANENLGHAYRDAGQPDQAAMHFRLAASIYGRVELHDDVEDCRVALEELGMSLDTSE